MTAWLESIKTAKLPKLGRYSHPAISEQEGGSPSLCAMEMVAFMEGESHTDVPSCVSLELAQVMQFFNDKLSDGDRQKLLPYLEQCVGTANDGLADKRQTILANMGVNRLMEVCNYQDREEEVDLQWRHVEFALNRLFSVSKPTSFTKPERIRELEALA